MGKSQIVSQLFENIEQEGGSLIPSRTRKGQSMGLVRLRDMDTTQELLLSLIKWGMLKC